MNENRDSCIIISASGMCEAGRILHHLKNGIGRKDNTVLFVGYCAENTLGWKIREGWDEIKIFGEPYDVKAEIETLDSFSGHADHSELLDYFDQLTGPKEKIWLVHGETKRSEVLCEALKERHSGGKTQVAELGQTVSLLD